jgi:hypothetical protein
MDETRRAGRAPFHQGKHIYRSRPSGAMGGFLGSHPGALGKRAEASRSCHGGVSDQDLLGFSGGARGSADSARSFRGRRVPVPCVCLRRVGCRPRPFWRGGPGPLAKSREASGRFHGEVSPWSRVPVWRFCRRSRLGRLGEGVSRATGLCPVRFACGGPAAAPGDSGEQDPGSLDTADRRQPSRSTDQVAQVKTFCRLRRRIGRKAPKLHTRPPAIDAKTPKRALRAIFPSHERAYLHAGP